MKSLNGETDLDILVHEDDKPVFEETLKRFHLKKVLSPPAKRIPGVEDYLGLDYASGRMIHLHLHYRLVLGERYIKNHHLPIEGLIFSNLIERTHVMIPCPEIELMLLIIRANMKIGADSIIKHALKNLIGKSYTPYPADIESEIEGLISECDIKKLKNLLRESGLPLHEDIFTGFIGSFTRKGLKFHEIMKWRRQILHQLRGYRRETNSFIAFKYYFLFVQNLPGINRFFKSGKKTLIGKGKVISIVGADGSGKSTIVKELGKWLSWKLDVKKVYFGIPKTNLVKGWDLAIRGFKKLRLDSIADLLSILLNVYIARLRFRTYNQAIADAAKGRAVITDRFPLREFWSMEEPMDGPRLSSRHSTIRRWFAEIEEGYYKGILLPDKVLVLQASVDDLRKRKTDLSYEKHRLKAEVVNALSESAIITLIDASRPYKEVLLDVKRKIWDEL